MVLPCESLFSRTSLDGRPLNLHTFSKVNLKYTKHTFPMGQRRCRFHLPHSYNLQILLARGNGASTNVEPCLLLLFCRIQLQRGKWLCCTMDALVAKTIVYMFYQFTYLFLNPGLRVASLIVLLLEYPRGKRKKGNTIERK